MHGTFSGVVENPKNRSLTLPVDLPEDEWNDDIISNIFFSRWSILRKSNDT
jgi:hypothetical protein